MKRKGIGVCFCAALFTVCSIIKAASPADRLHKAIHYEAKEQQGSLGMDLGKIVLLFHSPKKVVDFTMTRKQDGTGTKDVYVFPSSVVEGKDGMKFINQLNAATSKHYRFELQPANGNGKPGLQLVVQYDPKKVSVESRLFKTISSDKGVEFRFHNQDLIDAIRERSEAKTRISSLKKKESSLLTADMEELIRGPQVFLA